LTLVINQSLSALWTLVINQSLLKTLNNDKDREQAVDVLFQAWLNQLNKTNILIVGMVMALPGNTRAMQCGFKLEACPRHSAKDFVLLSQPRSVYEPLTLTQYICGFTSGSVHGTGGTIINMVICHC